MKLSSVWNLPNLLSLTRIALIPVFIILIIHKRPLAGFTVFVIAGATDVLDGLAARVRHEKTRLGTLLDPAADKLLLTASFILLSLPAESIPNSIPLWLTLTVIGRDLAIAAGSLIILKLKGRKSFLPTILGKTSTVLQVGTVAAVLFLNLLRLSRPTLTSALFGLTLVVTLASGIHYAVIGLKMLSLPAASPSGERKTPD